MTLTEFLLLRVAEDEAEAHAALREYEESPPLAYDMAQVPMLDAGDPDRVLAECAAKRAIVEEHEPVDYSSLGMSDPNACRTCGVDIGIGDWEWDEGSFPCLTLRALAAVYADHPDYDETWRP